MNLLDAILLEMKFKLAKLSESLVGLSSSEIFLGKDISPLAGRL